MKSTELEPAVQQLVELFWHKLMDMGSTKTYGGGQSCVHLQQSYGVAVGMPCVNPRGYLGTQHMTI